MNWYDILYFIFIILFIVFLAVTIAGAVGMASKSPADAWMWTLLIVGAVGTVACALFLLYDAHRIEEQMNVKNMKKRRANLSVSTANNPSINTVSTAFTTPGTAFNLVDSAVIS